MTWVVVVTQSDYYSGEDDDDLYGPFRTRETAEQFMARVETALPSFPETMNGSLLVSLRFIQPPRVRPIVRDAKRFIDEVEQDVETDSLSTTSGMYSIDHAD